MKRIQLGLWNGDPEYGRRIITYIRTSDYRERIAPVLFTDRASCLLRLENPGSVLDILAADRELLDDGFVTGIAAAGCLVVSLGEERVTEKAASDRHELEKFQPINRLLDAILGLLPDSAPGCRAENGRHCYTLAVYSASGGAGKTVFAYTAAGLLAKMGFRPAVITLESVPSPCWRAAARDDVFGRALYEAVKSGSRNQAKLDNLFVEDAARKIRYLPAAQNPEELEQMGETETLRLLEAASRYGRSDVLILDLDSGLFPRTLAALTFCDHAVCLVPPCSFGSWKTGVVLGRLENLLGKPFIRSVSCILNMAEGPAAGPQSGIGHHIEDILPMQPEWRGLTSIGKLHGRSLYQERLFYWLSGQMNRLRPEKEGGILL